MSLYEEYLNPLLQEAFLLLKQIRILVWCGGEEIIMQKSSEVHINA